MYLDRRLKYQSTRRKSKSWPSLSDVSGIKSPLRSVMDRWHNSARRVIFDGKLFWKCHLPSRCEGLTPTIWQLLLLFFCYSNVLFLWFFPCFVWGNFRIIWILVQEHVTIFCKTFRPLSFFYLVVLLQ